MDLDAILLFKQVLSNNACTDCEYLLMASAINNGTVDINKSMCENLVTAYEHTKIIAEIKVITELLSEPTESYLNIPIYELLLEKSCFWNLLKDAYGKKKLTAESMLNILEISLTLRESINREEEFFLMTFLTELISKRRDIKTDIFQHSKILTKFVADNDHLIVSSNGFLIERGSNKFSIRIFMLKLFAYGLVNYDYRLIALNDEDPLSGYQRILTPLITNRSYSHLRLLFNTKIVTPANVDIIISFIEEAFHQLYKYVSTEEELEKDKNIIESLNKFIGLLFNGKKINFDFMTDEVRLLAKINDA